MNGSDFLIYIDETTAITAAAGTALNYKAIAALTSNGFSGSTGSMATTNKDTGNWADSDPAEKSWSISGEGMAVAIGAGETTKVNYAKLSTLWKNGTKFWAKIANADDGTVREGVVYITQWDESYPQQDNFTFSATFQGCGEPNLTVV